MALDSVRARLTASRASFVCGLAPAVLLLLITAACGGGPKRPPTGTPEPDKFLFDRGTEALDKRRWLVAREYFRQLVDSYPQSRYRADAKLGVGDTFLGDRSAESFVLAANEFREFLTYYPTHAHADYAQYKLGMTYFYQMHGPERDQTETRNAIKELTVFVERYPTSSLAAEGKARLREARDRLSQADYRVGFFYWRSKWYPGAIDRFRAILTNDPQFTTRDAVYFHLADALEKIKRPAEALPLYEKLIAEFEQSEYLVESRRRSAALKAELDKTGKTGAAIGRADTILIPAQQSH
jgi:outer membrane protein assembly factor BamD